MCYYVKSNHKRIFAHVRINLRFEQRVFALRADDVAVVTDFLYMARTHANYYASVYRLMRREIASYCRSRQRL